MKKLQQNLSLNLSRDIEKKKNLISKSLNCSDSDQEDGSDCSAYNSDIQEDWVYELFYLTRMLHIEVVFYKLINNHIFMIKKHF